MLGVNAQGHGFLLCVTTDINDLPHQAILPPGHVGVFNWILDPPIVQLDPRVVDEFSRDASPYAAMHKCPTVGFRLKEHGPEGQLVAPSIPLPYPSHGVNSLFGCWSSALTRASEHCRAPVCGPPFFLIYRGSQIRRRSVAVEEVPGAQGDLWRAGRDSNP